LLQTKVSFETIVDTK